MLITTVLLLAASTESVLPVECLLCDSWNRSMVSSGQRYRVCPVAPSGFDCGIHRGPGNHRIRDCPIRTGVGRRPFNPVAHSIVIRGIVPDL